MIDERTKELIAVGASIAANCQPCLEYHTAKAREGGAAEQEIAQAVEVGKLVRTGAASKMDRFASSLAQAARPTAPASDKDCGCSRPAG
ncbi:MAG: carboxymuconolactone decarboxylase family protein [Pirellulales bacterium]